MVRDTTYSLSVYIKDKIIKCNKERNWMPHQLCERSGVSGATISLILNDNRLARLDTIMAISEAYDMSLSDFFSDYKN